MEVGVFGGGHWVVLCSSFHWASVLQDKLDMRSLKVYSEISLEVGGVVGQGSEAREVYDAVL